jgi:hypothetical protein
MLHGYTKRASVRILNYGPGSPFLLEYGDSQKRTPALTRLRGGSLRQ